MQASLQNTNIAGQKITMTALDEKLSEWVNVARTVGPVIVHRYDAPWVCIISYRMWGDVTKLSSYLPDLNHPLLKLREAIDEAFAYENALLHNLGIHHNGRDRVAMGIRIWILQIVYSCCNIQHVCEQMRYNMLWRWFIGLNQTSDPLPEGDFFTDDIRKITCHPKVIQMIDRCLKKSGLLEHDNCGFRVNLGLLHTLLEQSRTSGNFTD